MEDRIRSLEEAVAQLASRIERLESLLRVRMPADRSAQPEPRPAAAPAVAAPTGQTSAPSAPPAASAESAAGGLGMSHLLAVVAVVCFVLAGTFIVKLAIESGWLTPERQWALAVFLGFALCGAGRFLGAVERGYRSYLSAAGVVVLYIAAFASSLYFDLVSDEVSILLGMGVTALCLALFHFHRTDVFAIVAAVGTYASPILLGRGSPDFWLNAAFFLLWAAVFSWFSTFFRSRTLSLVASYLGLGVFALLHTSPRPEQIGAVIVVETLQFAIFAWGVAHYSVRAEAPLTTGEAWSYFPILCFYYGLTYYFLNLLAPRLAPWLALGFAALLLAFYRRVRSRLESVDPLASRQIVYAFLSLVLFHAGYLEILPAQSKPWLLPLFLIVSYLSEQRGSFPKTARSLRFLVVAIGFFEFLKICSGLIAGRDTNALVVGLATLAIGIVYYLQMGGLLQAKAGVFLAAVHVLAVLAGYRIAYPLGSLAVSLVWAAYAAVILGMGYSRRDALLARSSLSVLLVAALKALLYDASRAPTGVRILCLLLTGALLYGTGTLFQRMADWKRAPEPPPA
jgi:hypothetical protein